MIRQTMRQQRTRLRSMTGLGLCWGQAKRRLVSVRWSCSRLVAQLTRCCRARRRMRGRGCATDRRPTSWRRLRLAAVMVRVAFHVVVLLHTIMTGVVSETAAQGGMAALHEAIADACKGDAVEGPLVDFFGSRALRRVALTSGAEDGQAAINAVWSTALKGQCKRCEVVMTCTSKEHATRQVGGKPCRQGAGGGGAVRSAASVQAGSQGVGGVGGGELGRMDQGTVPALTLSVAPWCYFSVCVVTQM